MENFEQVKKELHLGDQRRVAEMLGVSHSLVLKVTNGHRKDHHKIKASLAELVKSRKELAKKLQKSHV